MLITNRARARVNHGRWITDCPRPHCANAVALEPGQAVFQCAGAGGCQLLAEVEWPPDADEIWDALAERPVPTTRNWYPAGHIEAARLGLPHGQSPQQLRQETADHQEEMS